MTTIIIFLLCVAASALCLAVVVWLIDARVDASIREHVDAALRPTPEEAEFESHVTQALDITKLPTQRRPADELSETQR